MASARADFCDRLRSVSCSQPCRLTNKGLARASRAAWRSCGGLPRIDVSIAYKAPILLIASAATGDPRAWCKSKNLRRTCAACRLPDRAVSVQRIKSAIGIGLQDPLERLQMPLWVLTPPIRRVGKPHSGWTVIAGGPVVPHISPQAAGLRLSFARCKHRHRRVIGVQLVCG